MSKPIMVISGGQTGVDQAALTAAVVAGIATGGLMPKGFRTLAGPRPEFASMYGMHEHPSPEYRPRTWENVRQSSTTLRLADKFSSAGERCTLRAIKAYKKPYLDIAGDTAVVDAIALVMPWLIKHDVMILNVAGNSEETAPGIYDRAFTILLGIFRGWRCAVDSLV